MVFDAQPSHTASAPGRERWWPRVQSWLTDRSARREPPDLLVTALLAMMPVVAAVCVLATDPHTWTLLLAIAAMIAGTLLLVGVIGLPL